MEITSNYSITRLFLTKEVEISIDKINSFKLILKPIKDLFSDKDWNVTYHMWAMSAKSLQKALYLNEEQNFTSLQILEILLFDLGKYDKFRNIYTMFKKELEELIPNIQFKDKHLKVNDVTITDDIWEYILYLLKLSNGERIEKPLIFSSEEARQFYLAQKAAEDKIKKVKSSKQGDEDGLSKMMLTINYKFPGLSFDYLFNQTLAQIQWLQKYAAGAVSYEVNAQAFAAGNVKKGKKLDFFIK